MWELVLILMAGLESTPLPPPLLPTLFIIFLSSSSSSTSAGSAASLPLSWSEAPVVPPQRRLSGQLLRRAALPRSGRRRWLILAVGRSDRLSSALPPPWHQPVAVDVHAPHRFLSGTGPPRRHLPVAGWIVLRRLSPAGGPGRPSIARRRRGSAPGTGER